MTTLIYRGGATLTFGSGSGRRVVKRGESFEVSAELATVLLADPAVEGYEAPAVSADVPRETPEAAAPTKAQLLEVAAALGLELPKRATNDAITAAIAAEEQRLADEAAASGDGGGNQGGTTSANDPGAESPGEADTPPAETGAITLADIPDSAKVGKST